MSADNQTCGKRNIHGRKLKEINKVIFENIGGVVFQTSFCLYDHCCLEIIVYLLYFQKIFSTFFSKCFLSFVSKWKRCGLPLPGSSLLDFTVSVKFVLGAHLVFLWVVFRDNLTSWISQQMADHWETAPRHMMRLDIRSLLQDAAIEEVSVLCLESSAKGTFFTPALFQKNF